MRLHPDAIPTSEQVRETLADRVYYPYQKQIWIAGAVLILGILAFLGLRQYERNRREARWEQYVAAMQRGPQGPGGAATAARDRVAALERFLREHPESDAAPFALVSLAMVHQQEKQYAEAIARLDELQRRYPDFYMNTTPGTPPEDPTPRSLTEAFRARLETEAAWIERTRYVHPAPAADPLALVETSEGSFWLGFYPEAAPEHVANFVRLAKSGWFNGTQVFDVRTAVDGKPQLFVAGSAASKPVAQGGERDPALHDRDEPTATLEPEDARQTIRHQYRVVSAADMPSGESAHRFMVITAPDGMERYDGETTPFAYVLDREGSLETLDRIGRATTYGTHPDTKDQAGALRMRDHPYPPVHVFRVTVWEEEQLASDHSWDTAAAGSGEPPDWAKALPPPPLPAEFAAPEPQGPKDGDSGSEEPGEEEPSEPDDPQDTDSSGTSEDSD